MNSSDQHRRLTVSCFPLAKRFFVGILALAASFISAEAAAAEPTKAAKSESPEIGKPLSAWTTGTLDIHHINTGRGDSIFYVLPDGTTMLVDTGDGQANPLPSPFSMPTKPNNSRQSGEWISRYVLRTLRDFPEKKIDYAILSHFHGDHMGAVSVDSPKAPRGDYALTGITEIPEFIPVAKIIDRNWPDYNYPTPLKLDNYRSFLTWQMSHRGLEVEQFVSGRNDQIVLRHDATAYPTFEIRNLIANGRVWTGNGAEVREIANRDKGEILNENEVSIGFRVTYGKFDYFTGGDLSARTRMLMGSSEPWQDVELAAAQASGPVDVMKANHHGSWDANCAEFLSLLQPRVIVVTSRADGHPAVNTFMRMQSNELWPGPRDIFITNVTPSTRATSYGVDKAKSGQGHVVVRVDAGGDTYRVYSLDDSDEKQRVLSVFGPYKSR